MVEKYEHPEAGRQRGARAQSRQALFTRVACAITFFTFCCPAPAGAKDQLRIGALSLDWPEGYRSERSGEELLLRGPDDERVVVSYSRGMNHFDLQLQERFAKMHRSFALRTLHAMAAGSGTVVQDLQIVHLSRDTVVYSTASRVRHASAESYYLQYFVAGPFSVALFKVQGDGETMRAKRRFDAMFSSAHWNEAVVTARIR
jgi:hypothetical protein